MNEKKFTPGPWERSGANIYAESWAGDRNANGCVFVGCATEDRTPFEVEANADLGAAAPDLYDALEEALEDLKLWHESQFKPYDGQFVTARCEGCATCETIVKVQSALAKARGEM